LIAGDLNNFITEEGGKAENMKLYLRIFLQLIAAVSAVHEKREVHRDIKSENAFLKYAKGSDDLNEATVKLGDFGISRTFST